MSSLGALQGRFAAPLTAATALAPVAGPALAASLGSYTAMAYATAAAAGVAAVIAGFLPRTGAAPPDRSPGPNRTDSAPLAGGKTGK
jgi:hypothetical protein